MTSTTRNVAQLKSGEHVVVVGGGPAGLTAAYLLAKDGVRVTVLEADSVVGGIARTVRYGRYRFDIGGHRFFTKIQEVEQLWHEILGEDFRRVRRLSRILYRGRLFDYPLRARNVLAGLGLINAARDVFSYLRARVLPVRPEVSFEDWVTNRFGRRLYEQFFKTYTEKVWGLPCSEIQAEWAAQRIQDLSLGRAILNATSLNRRPTQIKSLIEEFQYPRLGPGQMWERCRDRIAQMGGDVLLNHRADVFEVEEQSLRSVRVRTDAGSTRIAGDHFLVSMPLGAFVRALEPAASADAREAADGLRYRAIIVVALIVDAEKLWDDNWIYVHTPGLRVGRIQNFNNWSPDLVPVDGKTCLGMEYFCTAGDELWGMSDEELIALATRELARTGLRGADRISDGSVVRMPGAYPVYDTAYREHLTTIRSHIDPLRNLHMIGRNGMHKYNNQDHSMLTAMLAIENMRGAREDVWAVNTDFEYHERLRREAVSR